MLDKYLERARELKESVIGNYEHSTDIQDAQLVDWLIAQAERFKELEQILLEEIEEAKSWQVDAMGRDDWNEVAFYDGKQRTLEKILRMVKSR